MALSYVATGTTVITVGSTSASVTLPTGIQAGDLLIAWLGFGIVPSSVSGMTGWTAFSWSPQTDGTNNAQYAYWKLAGSSETNPSVTWSTTAKGVFTCVAYRGADQTTPIIASDGRIRTTSTTDVVTANLANPDATAWAVMISATRSSTSGNKAIAYTPDAALTERNDTNNSAAGSSPWVGVQVADSNGAVTAAAHLYTAVANFTEAHHTAGLFYIVPASTLTTIRSSGSYTNQSVDQTIPSVIAGDTFVYVGMVSDGDNVHRGIDSPPTLGGVSLTAAPGLVTSSGQNNQVDAYILKNVTGGTNVTLHTSYHSSSPGYLGAWYLIKNADTASQPRTSGSDAQNGSSPSISLASLDASDLIIEAIASSSTPTSSTGQSTVASGSGNGSTFRTTYKQATAGTNAETWTQSSNSYAYAAVVVKGLGVVGGGGGGTTGQIKVWNGTAFVAKPVKVWNGTAWVVKPLKVWNGTAWVVTNY